MAALKFQTLILSLILPCTAIAQSIVVSEVMFNPDGDENAREFVELYNAGDSDVSLEGWIISDGEDADQIIPVDNTLWILPPGSYALIFDPDYFSAGEPYAGIPEGIPLFTVDDKAIGSRGLSNSTAEPVLLLSADGDTVSVVWYSLDCPPGHSWERILITGDDNPDNFAPSDKPEGTPGRMNSAAPPRINPAITEDDIAIMPESPSMGDMITISVRCRNAGTESFDNPHVTVILQPDVTIMDEIIPVRLDPGDVSETVTKRYNSVYGGLLSFTAIVNVQNASPKSADDDTASTNLNVPIPAGTILLTEIMAAPSKGKPEWIEVLNISETPVSMYGWSISDESGAASAPLNFHIRLEEGSYALMTETYLSDYSIPDTVPVIVIDNLPPLNNDGDTVDVMDGLGGVLDSSG